MPFPPHSPAGSPSGTPGAATPSGTPAVALTIAGSDSSGGAGMHADLRTMSALGVHGATAITLLTAQNTTGILSVQPVPATFVTRQIDAVLADLNVAAVKTGMLAAPEIIDAVADFAESGRLKNLVVDPVLVNSSGQPLFSAEAARGYRTRLFPHALVITPNVAEAELLTGLEITDNDGQRRAAKALAETGAEVVVVKGGGRSGMLEAVDVVYNAGTGDVTELNGDWVETTNVHGSGCTLAAAITANLAIGATPVDAIAQAKIFVDRAIAAAKDWRLGTGHGPVNQFFNSSRQPADGAHHKPDRRPGGRVR